MIPLKSTLIINAASSGATGLGLIAFSELVARLFEVDSTLPFLFTGLFLVVFAVFVFVEGRQRIPRPGWVLIITTLDVLWVLASMALVLSGKFKISSVGEIAIVVVAVWVSAMALLQSRGIKKLVV